MKVCAAVRCCVLMDGAVCYMLYTVCYILLYPNRNVHSVLYNVRVIKWALIPAFFIFLSTYYCIVVQ
jgi:hypothetical protein